jgi:uncharacterized membrane protein YidH (DUF202 family)
MQPDDQWRQPPDPPTPGAPGTPAAAGFPAAPGSPADQPGPDGSAPAQSTTRPAEQGFRSSPTGQPGPYAAPAQQGQYGAPAEQQSWYGAPEQGQRSYGSAPDYPVYPGGGPPPGYGGPTQAYTQGQAYGAPADHYNQYAGGYAGFNPYQPYGASYQPRPSGGTVITAAVIQIVQAALGVLAGLLVAFAGDFIRNNANELDDRGLDAESAQAVSSVIVAIGLVILLVSVFLIVLAALALQRHRWALVTSVVLQCIWLVLSLVGLASANDASGASVIGILASAAVVILFLLPQSAAYIASRQASWPQSHR